MQRDEEHQERLMEAGLLAGVELSPEAIDEAFLAAQKAKADAEATRAFVLEHVQKLRGKTMPLEIYSVQNLPSHSCLIVNDHFLLSYVEAEEMIKALGADHVD